VEHCTAAPQRGNPASARYRAKLEVESRTRPSADRNLGVFSLRATSRRDLVDSWSHIAIFHKSWFC
jgi:hypothetical protein